MDYENETYFEDYSFLNLSNRPKIFTVLLLLSSIYILTTLTNVTQKLIEGPMTQIQLDSQMSELSSRTAILVSQGADPNLYQSTDLLIRNTRYINNEVFYLSNISKATTLLIGLTSVLLMLFMFKSGFFLYIIYSLLPIVTMYITTPKALILTPNLVFYVSTAIICISIYIYSYLKTKAH